MLVCVCVYVCEGRLKGGVLQQHTPALPAALLAVLLVCVYVCVGVRLEGGRGNGGDPCESAAGPQVRRCLFKRMSSYAPTSARH
jgi:hypothetical protein